MPSIYRCWCLLTTVGLSGSWSPFWTSPIACWISTLGAVEVGLRSVALASAK
jgi:hypothetical protein